MGLLISKLICSQKKFYSIRISFAESPRRVLPDASVHSGQRLQVVSHAPSP